MSEDNPKTLLSDWVNLNGIECPTTRDTLSKTIKQVDIIRRKDDIVEMRMDAMEKQSAEATKWREDHDLKESSSKKALREWLPILIAVISVIVALSQIEWG